MNAADYIEKWTECLSYFGINDFSDSVGNEQLIKLMNANPDNVLESVVKCIPDKSRVFVRGGNIYGNLLGVDKILSTWLTEEMIGSSLIPTFSYLSGEFLLISVDPQQPYKCRWLHSRYFYYKEDGLSRFLSGWQDFPWEVLRKIKRKGRFYWDDVDIESWSDFP